MNIINKNLSGLLFAYNIEYVSINIYYLYDFYAAIEKLKKLFVFKLYF